VPCPRCGQATSARAKFCGECGASLDSVQPAAERRQITVMFCDLVGSTSLAARLDPEELRDLIREYQSLCAQTVQRFDGSVAQYLGDGVLIYFGAPHAHEDDASRAGHAGLDIVQAVRTLGTEWASRLRVELSVRIGIHTGPVVVGEVGGGARTETLAIGETPNIAARLQAAARPNTIVVSDATYRLLSRAFRCHDRGQLTLAGLNAAVHAYEIVERSDVEMAQRPGQDADPSTLVGRAWELGVLRDHWRKARDGSGGVVMLRGEAGIGKSMLVEALKADVTRDDGLVLQGDCSPYYENSAFFAVTRLLRRWCGFQSSDTPSDQQHKVAAALAAVPLADAAAEPLIANLLSVAVDVSHPVFKLGAALQRARTLNLLLAIPLALARQQPVMLLLEDLHWADPSTLEFLEAAVSRLQQSPVLAVLTARPEFSADWLAASHVTRIELGGIDRAGAESLVARAIGGKSLPPEVVDQILQRADGVPLFIEETTRAIVDSDVLHDAGAGYELRGPLPPNLVPVTLQDALMARLDRLESAKPIVQLGAAIGREFTYELLSAASGEDDSALNKQLERAVSSGLLQRWGVPPDATFVFKHALIQETAYQSLLRKTRQQYHQRIADALEQRFPAVTERRPELLAHHYTEAGAITQAIPYWRRAGNQAIARAAFAEATSHLSRGLNVLESLPTGPERDREALALWSTLGMALQAHRGYAAPEVEHAYRMAREVCQRAGTADDLLSVCRGQNLYHIARADYRTAAAMAHELMKVGTETQSIEHLIEGSLMLGVDEIYQARFLESRKLFERGLALLTSDTGPRPQFQYVGHSSAFSRSYLGRTLSFLGYHDRALEASTRGLEVAQTLSIPMSVAQAMGMHMVLQNVRGDVSGAEEWAAKTLAYANEYGLPYWVSLGSIVQGWALGHRGQLERGIGQLRQGIDRNLATGAKVGRSWFLVMLAELCCLAGAWDEGLDAIASALTHAEETGERYYEAEAFRMKGELLRARGGSAPAEAETCFRKAITVSRDQHARTWELRASIGLARLWRDTGRAAEGLRTLTASYEWFTEGYDVPDLQAARQVLGELTAVV
jgi:class 3 adenylate cyclase/predicted ATPase